MVGLLEEARLESASDCLGEVELSAEVGGLDGVGLGEFGLAAEVGGLGVVGLLARDVAGWLDGSGMRRFALLQLFL